MSDFSDSPPLALRPRGRGTGIRPANRFLKHSTEASSEYVESLRVAEEELIPRSTAEIISDDSQSIITKNNSPDLGFDFSLNPYRGCEHGCAYCYARPFHEYLGFDAGLDFETKIMAKKGAAALLEEKLARPSWQPSTLSCSGVTDPYQPIERELEITRGCLEVLASCRHPVGMITKNHLITRDKDHLAELASHGAAMAHLSITTLDTSLATLLEPRASTPRARLAAIRELTEAGIPTAVAMAPIIPGLTDHEIFPLLEAAAEAGAVAAFYTVARLPDPVGEIFEGWLEEHFPDRKEKILGRIREAHGGELKDSTFGRRIRGGGQVAADIAMQFRAARKRWGLDRGVTKLSTSAFRRPLAGQRELF